MGAPKGGGPEGWGPRRVGGPKFRVFFFSVSRHQFSLFLSLLGVLSWNFGGVFVGPGRLELAGCRVKPRT